MIDADTIFFRNMMLPTYEFSDYMKENQNDLGIFTDQDNEQGYYLKIHEEGATTIGIYFHGNEENILTC